MFLCLQAKRLEAKDKQLKNQDAFYKEQLRKMEERVFKTFFSMFCASFTYSFVMINLVTCGFKRKTKAVLKRT